MLIERYKDEDQANMVELIVNLAREHAIWFSQAHESLYVCKYQEQYARVVPYLINSIQDRHLRFAVAA